MFAFATCCTDLANCQSHNERLEGIIIDTSANRNTLINCGRVVQYGARSKGKALRKVIGKYTI